MEILQYALMLLVILVAFPIGFLLAKLTKEELKSGRVWFQLVIVLAIVITIASICSKLCLNDILITVTSMLFIIIIAGISLVKSKKRIVKK